MQRAVFCESWQPVPGHSRARRTRAGRRDPADSRARHRRRARAAVQARVSMSATRSSRPVPHSNDPACRGRSKQRTSTTPCSAQLSEGRRAHREGEARPSRSNLDRLTYRAAYNWATAVAHGEVDGRPVALWRPNTSRSGGAQQRAPACETRHTDREMVCAERRGGPTGPLQGISSHGVDHSSQPRLRHAHSNHEAHTRDRSGFRGSLARSQDP